MAVLLWPDSLQAIGDRPGQLLAAATAIVVWIAAEWYFSEEVLLRQSSPHDVRIGRDILSKTVGAWRDLLKDHNTWTRIDDDRYNDLDKAIEDFRRGKTTFQNKKVNDRASTFYARAQDYSRFIAEHGDTVHSGHRLLRGFKPFETVPQEEYDERGRLSEQANALADTAWRALLLLGDEIRRLIPEALDEQI